MDNRPAVSRVQWHRAVRIIPSRFPPIDLFERVAYPADWERLANLEMLTNPRIRNEIGEIQLVPLDRRVVGPGATYVMAPFTHPNPQGSRFSDGSFGIYYAADSKAGAIAETVHHMAKFYAATADIPHREDMRVLAGALDADLHDIRVDGRWQECHNRDDHTHSRRLGVDLRRNGSNGIAYLNVRHPGGHNIAAFWPNVVAIPVQAEHLQYEWDGQRIRRYFDFLTETWTDI